MPENYIIGTLIPEHFLPGLGYVAVQNSQLDHSINETIWFLGTIDAAAGIAITSTVANSSTRIEMLRRLVKVKVADEKDQKKLLALLNRADEVIGERNRFSHDRPYYYSPKNDEVGFFRDVNLSNPQIKIQPPTRITTEFLQKLGAEMFRLVVWLGMYRSKHPDWSDDAQFPWQDKLPK